MSHVALLFLRALSPLHAGTGQGIGAIDLPIAREKATGIPYLPGSSLKGVLRDRASAWDRDTLFVFGARGHLTRRNRHFSRFHKAK